jgi:predicted ArsR family transcriptional regulator
MPPLWKADRWHHHREGSVSNCGAGVKLAIRQALAHGPATAIELSGRMKRNRATIQVAVYELCREGIVIRAGVERSGGPGQPKNVYALASQCRARGVDYDADESGLRQETGG